ncbi:hypothetical protein OG21DRAFT_1509080 [Imleria badia]|nr:hypothetical protein OG21DRAFT_1509080 [Imleria badia]
MVHGRSRLKHGWPPSWSSELVRLEAGITSLLDLAHRSLLWLVSAGLSETCGPDCCHRGEIYGARNTRLTGLGDEASLALARNCYVLLKAKARPRCVSETLPRRDLPSPAERNKNRTMRSCV